MQNSSSQPPEIGPASRSGSCAAWLTPNRVCAGMKLQSTRPGSAKNTIMKASIRMPARLPSASPSPDSGPTRSCGAMVGSMALWNTVENS